VARKAVNARWQPQPDEAAEARQPVAASFTLRLDPRSPPSPDEVESQVARLLARVAGQTGQQPFDVQVFGNIGSFAVSAPAEFVEQLARQPEIDTAMPSQPAEDVLIRPVRRRRVAGPQAEAPKEASDPGEDRR
jgi:hypothetical protein